VLGSAFISAAFAKVNNTAAHKKPKKSKNKQKRVPRRAARAKGRAEMARGSVRGGGRRKLVASASEINNNKC